MLDGKCTIRNKNGDLDAVSQMGSVSIFSDRDGKTFAIITSTWDQYILDTTLISHLGRSNSTCGVSFGGAVVGLNRLDIISCINCC